MSLVHPTNSAMESRHESLDHHIAVWVDNPGTNSRVRIRQDVPTPAPVADEVLVKMEFSGLCHSDVYNIQGIHPMSTNIPGHEGIGHIVQVGKDVPSSFLHQRVGIKWIYRSCHQCQICLRNETTCPKQNNSGRDMPGTLQQYMVVPARHVTVIPGTLSSEAAAPLLCAGLTMYSAILKCQIRESDWLILPGAGGGLGHLGLQIAAYQGLKVIAIDSGQEKKALCMELGATAFVDFKSEDVAERIKQLTNGYGAHAIICIAGSESAYDQALRLLRRNGVLVCVGLPSLDYRLAISPMEMVVRGLTVVGSSVGTENEMRELLELASAGHIVPRCTVFDLEDFEKAIEALKDSQIKGRAVLRLPQGQSINCS